MSVNERAVYDIRYFLLWNTHKKKPLFESQEIRNFVKREIKKFAKAREWEIHSLNVDSYSVEIEITVTPEYGPHKVFNDLRRCLNGPLKKKFPELKTKAPTIWDPSYYAQTIGKLDAAKVFQFGL